MHTNARAGAPEPVDAARRRPDRGERVPPAILELHRHLARWVVACGFAPPTLAACHVHLAASAWDARRTTLAAAKRRARRHDPAESPPPKARATGAAARPIRFQGRR